MDKTQVTKNGKPVGEVYYNPYSELWVAQLDKAISLRSQSFLTKEKAIEALENFEPSQLSGNIELMQVDAMAKVFGSIFNSLGSK